jgi:hypothetical protein
MVEKYPPGSPGRNAVRFKIRNLYKDAGEIDLALEELETILDENAP